MYVKGKWEIMNKRCWFGVQMFVRENATPVTLVLLEVIQEKEEGDFYLTVEKNSWNISTYEELESVLGYL
jgi:hypothetical protein